MNTKIDLIQKAFELTSETLLNDKTSAELFDIGLEAIGVIWLRYPNLISEEGPKTRKIFSTVVGSLNNPKI